MASQTPSPLAQALGMFNRKLFDMLEDLASSFPTVPEFGIAVSPTARMFMNLDPSKAQKMFHEYVGTPFEKHIVARDEAFLLSQNHEHFGVAASSGDIIRMIKGVWMEASVEDKDAIWKHLHVLIVLSRRCLAAATSDV